MDDFPWYRFYNETLSDKKIKRVCRDTGQCKALVIGAWATILALASESPERGLLLISDDIELTAEEIRDETGLDIPTFDALIAGFKQYGMLKITDGCWEISNWHKRQFQSDNSTERVRRHRQKVAVTETSRGNASGNNDETLPKRFSNVIDTDTEEDTDTEAEGEGEKSGATAPAHPPATSPRFQPVPESAKKRKKIDALLAPSPMPEMVATAPLAMTMMQAVTGHWPGDNNREFLEEQLGAKPDEAALKKAVKLWNAAGNKPTNYGGICEWYKEILRDPGWTPQARFKNGHGKPEPAKSVSTPAPGSQPLTW